MNKIMSLNCMYIRYRFKIECDDSEKINSKLLITWVELFHATLFTQLEINNKFYLYIISM